MRILTYKRTHIGDPDSNGVFGINDCMGRVRNLGFDAVIGIGGIGREPKSFGIDGKINWIGFKPFRQNNSNGNGVLINFERFALFEHLGPTLHLMAPQLAHRMYHGRVRYILTGYNHKEQIEAEGIIEWFLKQRLSTTKRLKPDRKSKNFFKKCLPMIKCRKRCK